MAKSSRSLGGLEDAGPLSPRNSTTSNPLSSKLNTVLATSYADSDFRDAIALLDTRSVRNTPDTRRQLRLQVQKNVIASSAGIIQEFRHVAEQLRRIGRVLDNVNATYGAMKASAAVAHASTSEFLDDANRLDGQRRQVDTKQLLLDRFHRQFVLGSDYVRCLTSMEESVDGRFFTALAKAKKITKDCEVLLGFEQQTLGRQIMDQTARTVNQAYHKLYKWVRAEFSSLNLENPQMGSSIRRALRVLAERRSLFDSCLEVFAESREQILSDAFFSALTGQSTVGGHDRSVKPIEMVAHDPLRYVGDMLAWTHSATVSEKEALEVFFISEADEIAKGIEAGRETEFWRLAAEERGEAPVFNATQALNNLVDRDTAGVARLLRQRVTQVIQANEDSTLAFRLSSLLGFYSATFTKLVGAETHLVETLAGLESEALRLFKSLMRDRVAAIQADLSRPPADLGCPEFLLEVLEELSIVIKTYETSLSLGSDREAEFADVLALALDPFLDGCEAIAAELGPPANSILRVNFLSAAQAKLQAHEFTKRRAGEMEKEISEERVNLITSQYHFLRDSSGLERLIETAQDARQNQLQPGQLRQLDALQPTALLSAAQILDDFLPSALMDALENVEGLQVAGLARQMTEKAADRFCEDFEQIEEMLMVADDAVNQDLADGFKGEGDQQLLRSLFPRTSGEIRVLLS
jgi:conserved oligomeric Golgi complex subunit 6